MAVALDEGRGQVAADEAARREGSEGGAAANKSMGPSSPWTRPRGRPWGTLSRTQSRRGRGRGAVAAEEATGRGLRLRG